MYHKCRYIDCSGYFLEMKTRRICYACDLIHDPSLIAEYRDWHLPGKVWPEVETDMQERGISSMEIYLTGNRLFMVTEVVEEFKESDATSNERVNKWEELMWKFQQALPWASKGEKWVRMERIYKVDFTVKK